MLGAILEWVGVSLFLTVIVIIGISDKIEKDWFIWVLILSFTGLLCFTNGSRMVKEQEIFKNLTQEVNREQIAEGKRQFKFQVQATFSREGELESVSLIPRTTLAVVN